MSTVFVLEITSDIGNTVVGVFTTLKKAKEASIKLMELKSDFLVQPFEPDEGQTIDSTEEFDEAYDQWTELKDFTKSVEIYNITELPLQ